MDELFYNLFSQAPGTDSGTQVALFAVSALLSCIAMVLLARRNDLGWWAQILAVFAGPTVVALQYEISMLFYAVPAMLAAAFGLWRFSKYEMAGRFGRKVIRREFSVKSLLIGLALLVVFGALRLGRMLTTGFIFSDGTAAVLVSLLAEATLVVALIGIACGYRWAWLAASASGVVYVAVLFGSNPALALLGVTVFQVLAGLYGWFVWRDLPTSKSIAADAESGSEYPPSPYTA
ncbi:nicotinamide mononucleotide transporter [Paeniglutamicibacter sp. NPDC012692]|uniref:nicotinamide mononucleotide transporter n=1 Tax=Paeniglutamicibacter sp. NPDC012692 TaxID=3364388 RepID=UPI0036C51A9A